MKTNVPMLWRLKDAKRYMGGNKQPYMILMSVIFFISVKAKRELRPRGTTRAAKSRSTFTSQHNKKVGSIPKKDESITSLPQKRNFFIENFLGKETFRKHYCKKAPRSQMHASKSTTTIHHSRISKRQKILS